MSADSWVEPHSAPSESSAAPFYFGPDEGRLLGWLHAVPATANTDLGLVLCQPFGYEAICSHRGARSLAEAAAALGVPALRFDYLGTGDSGEIDSDANQIQVWSQNILAAIDELQRRTGVSRVFLVGFRMGALLATLAAARCSAVQGLLLVAPVITGRRYLRELRTTRMASLLSTGESSAPAADPINSSGARSFEVSGFSLSPATVAALGEIDLMNLQTSVACDTLVIDGTTLPAARAWVDQLNNLGRPVHYQALPGVLEMMITAPQFLISSLPMVAAAGEWLGGFLNASPESASSQPARAASQSASSIHKSLPPQDFPSSDAALMERPIFFGPNSGLFGIVTEPAAGEIRRRGVIVLNSGADSHVGPSRIYVSVARRWARSGYFVLRMDLSGLGESTTRPDANDDEVFPPRALDDIRAAVETLRASYGIHDITLAGLCSGAYHALRAAVAGIPTRRILMVNPLNFFWKEGMMLHDLQVSEVILNPGRYRQRVLSIAAWRRLLTGRVNVWRIPKIYVQRTLLPIQSMFRNIARSLRIRLTHDLGRELEEIVARGVQIVFVFAHGEPGIDLLKMEGGSSVKRIGAKCRIRVIERADHAFSHSGPRAALEDILSEELSIQSNIGSLHPQQGLSD